MIKFATAEVYPTARKGVKKTRNRLLENCSISASSTGEFTMRIPKPQPEVIPVNIQLPGMSRIKLDGVIQGARPSSQAVGIAGCEETDRAFNVRQVDNQGCLLKKSVLERVLRAFEDMRRGGASTSSEIVRKPAGYFRTQETNCPGAEKLSSRERQVLERVNQGHSNKEIAAQLSVSVYAVRWHLKHIYRKLNVHSRTDAVIKFRPGGQTTYA